MRLSQSPFVYVHKKYLGFKKYSFQRLLVPCITTANPTLNSAGSCAMLPLIHAFYRPGWWSGGESIKPYRTRERNFSKMKIHFVRFINSNLLCNS